MASFASVTAAMGGSCSSTSYPSAAFSSSSVAGAAASSSSSSSSSSSTCYSSSSSSSSTFSPPSHPPSSPSLSSPLAMKKRARRALTSRLLLACAAGLLIFPTLLAPAFLSLPAAPSTQSMAVQGNAVDGSSFSSSDSSSSSHDSSYSSYSPPYSPSYSYSPYSSSAPSLRAAKSQRSGRQSSSLLGSGALLTLSALMAGLAGYSRRTSTSSKARSSLSAAAVNPMGQAPTPILKIGTRGSPLALAQANETKKRLETAFPELRQEGAIEIRTISTTGDERLDISLSAIGGKGLFTKELDVALMSGEVDFCVHSTKDVPTVLVPGTKLCTMLPREDTRDAIISPKGITKIEDFPAGSVIGTASLRRQAQIYARNPNVTCVNFRGNVQTRLKKLNAGEVDATLLAYAGLKRMGMEGYATAVLEWDQMLPAIAQGAISFQCKSDDARVLSYLEPLSHLETVDAVVCERAFLAALDGNCRTPIAGQAWVNESGELHFEGLVASVDGKQVYRASRVGPRSEAARLGQDAAEEIRKAAGEQFFLDMQEHVEAAAAANTKPTKA